MWNAVQSIKASQFRLRAERLLLRLHGILFAEHASSEVGRSPERLKASVGTTFGDAFDFDVMSRVLVRAKPGVRMSDDRRKRIQHLIDVLEGQRFFPLKKNVEPYEFTFYRCSDALNAYRERRHHAAELLKTLTIAELEVSGEYRESERSTAIPTHDALFEEFGVDTLDADDLSKLQNISSANTVRSLMPKRHCRSSMHFPRGFRSRSFCRQTICLNLPAFPRRRSLPVSGISRLRRALGMCSTRRCASAMSM